MDSENHLTVMLNGRAVWEGSYEAFIADGDIRVPSHLADRIHRRAETISTLPSELDERD